MEYRSFHAARRVEEEEEEKEVEQQPSLCCWDGTKADPVATMKANEKRRSFIFLSGVDATCMLIVYLLIWR